MSRNVKEVRNENEYKPKINQEVCYLLFFLFMIQLFTYLIV